MAKAFIFDFNGVLWWDTALQEQAWDEMASKLRGRPFTKEEKFNHLHGRPNRYILEYLAGRKMSEGGWARLAQEKEDIYQKLCLQQRSNFKLSPGATNFLGSLGKAGILMTIATSSGKSNVDFFVKNLNLGKWFDVSKIVYDDRTFPGKPAPDIYLRACIILKVDPGDAVVVEDSKSGIEAAYAAGIGRIIALGPRPKWDELSVLKGVSEVVEDLGQVKVEI